jgi:hypothetical protein
LAIQSRNAEKVLTDVDHCFTLRWLCVASLRTDRHQIGMTDRHHRNAHWQIETFFKSLKQLLKIKTFVGTSEKAVLTQIWTALITMLLLRWLKLKAQYGWSLSNLLALLRQQLFVYRELYSWLDNPFTGPPAISALEAQLALDLR